MAIAALTAVSAGAANLVPGCDSVPSVFSGVAGGSTLSAFESAIGGTNNGTAPPQTSGFRSVNWDGVLLDGTDLGGASKVIVLGKVVNIPASRFQSRGIMLDATDAVSGDGFLSVNPNVTGQFPAFSASNVFAPFNSNTVNVNFVVPGTSTPALSNAFGAVFLDVGDANTTAIQFFNGNNLLGTYFAPTGTAGQPVFLGVVYPIPVFTSVKITLGTARIFTFNGVTFVSGSAESLPGTDLVAMDDFVYGEPRNAPPPFAVSGLALSPFSGNVASFVDPDPSAVAQEFTATIDWGDGTMTSGTVASTLSCFNISGGHTYATGGIFTITTTIVDFSTLALVMHTTATITPLPAGDFQGDRKSDLFWRNVSTGDDSVWLINGIAVAVSASMPTVDPSFHIVGLGDFNADAIADVLWRSSTTGANVLWLMNGASPPTGALLPTVADLNWKVAGVGDFNGDGKADILWRNSLTGDNAVWLMNGPAILLAASLPPVYDLNWKVAAIGDLDGNGTSDVVWRNTVTGDNVVWFMSGTSVSSSGVLPSVTNTNWQIIGAGDFQGDARSDLLWRNSVTGDNALWLMNGAAVAFAAALPSVLDPNWKVVRIGDFQGDGKADIFWRNSATGDNAVWLMNGAAVAVSAAFPTVSDVNWQVAGPP